MKTLRLAPAAGYTVLNPDNNRPLGQNGEVVPSSIYWRKLLAEGAVVEVVPAQQASRSKAKA